MVVPVECKLCIFTYLPNPTVLPHFLCFNFSFALFHFHEPADAFGTDWETMPILFPWWIDYPQLDCTSLLKDAVLIHDRFHRKVSPGLKKRKKKRKSMCSVRSRQFNWFIQYVWTPEQKIENCCSTLTLVGSLIQTGYEFRSVHKERQRAFPSFTANVLIK